MREHPARIAQQPGQPILDEGPEASLEPERRQHGVACLLEPEQELLPQCFELQ